MGNTLKIAFDPANPPKPGYVLEDNGFRYTLKAVRPHKNAAGEPSLVTTWDCICAHDGVHFEAKAGAKIYSLPRRCKAHNIGWVKAYPFGAPRPDNAPMAVALADGAAFKRFVDDFGIWVEDGAEEGGKTFTGDVGQAMIAYGALCKFLELRFPGILDEPGATDLLS